MSYEHIFQSFFLKDHIGYHIIVSFCCFFKDKLSLSIICFVYWVLGILGWGACWPAVWVHENLGFFNTWVLGGIYWPAVWVLEYLGTLIREYLGTCWPAVWVFWYFDTWLLGGHLLTWFLGTWVFDTWLLEYLGYLLTCCSGTLIFGYLSYDYLGTWGICWPAVRVFSPQLPSVKERLPVDIGNLWRWSYIETK